MGIGQVGFDSPSSSLLNRLNHTQMLPNAFEGQQRLVRCRLTCFHISGFYRVIRVSLPLELSPRLRCLAISGRTLLQVRTQVRYKRGPLGFVQLPEVNCIMVGGIHLCQVEPKASKEQCWSGTSLCFNKQFFTLACMCKQANSIQNK